MNRFLLLLSLAALTVFNTFGQTKLVTGKFIDQKTDRVISELEVTVRNIKTGASQTVETNDDGVFEFKDVPFGKSELIIADKDYVKQTYEFELLEETHAEHYTFNMAEPFTAALKVSWMFNWGDRGEQEHYWSHLTAKIILAIYGLCLLLIFFYSVLQLSLAINYNRHKKGMYLYKSFAFTGRIDRRDYTISMLIFLTIAACIQLIFLQLPNSLEYMVIYLVVMIIPIFYIVAQTTKRCHDINVSGWHQLIPFYNVYLLFAKGDQTENNYGPSIYSLNKKNKPAYNMATAPFVTVQLPMYNELYVADRIIETCAAFDYPTDKLQIQVLDDSTDETRDVIAKKVAEVAATGINIQHVHRVDRTGYKAGALDAAMDQVQGDFIAIFDADFVPDADFLQKTMPYFNDPGIGVVQTRWGHINKDYSLLTELQAFGLNGHFAIEQGGRNSAGHFINFNGTGGVWRKQCIEEAGGWEHDTLTEDLDLSYRAQMKGWKFKYLEEVIAPAELPITMSALKSQQHRWMKGGAECFIKMWKRLLTAKNVRVSDRIHGLSHLFNSSVFVFILTLSLLSLPILHVKDSFSDLNLILQFMAIFILSTIFLMFYYWNSYRDKKPDGIKSFIRFVGRFFQFLIVSMGLSLSNTVAVIEGYLGIKSSFVRTPKFNVAKKSEFKGNKYDKKSLNIINIGEGILMVVFGFTAINRAVYGDLGMVPFHLMLAIGYGLVFFYTIKEVRDSRA